MLALANWCLWDILALDTCEMPDFWNYLLAVATADRVCVKMQTDTV